jgi:ATP-dependent DNA helicase RecQ
MSTSLRPEAEHLLRALVGHDDAALRDDQWAAIEALVVHRRRALVVQRTGWGKSAVYFVASGLLRARGAGPTLIVSPLLALMRNQVDAAARAGIRAHTINSSNTEEWTAVEGALDANGVDVLLVGPERLNNPDFRDRVLPPLAARIGLLVVDEAHCISDWGHDFRPDYRRIREALARLRPDVPVLATTATANQRVVDDVAEQLALGADGTRHDVLVQRGPLERESLRLGVLRLPDAAHQLGWLAEHLDDLPGSGIIYTLTVAGAEDLATYLRSAGHDVVAYSGRTDTDERLGAERALVENRVKALVATSALGMGFDKPDLGFVVHVGAPQSPIAYYQQVGRAGRAVDRADVLLLPGREDEAIWRYFGSLAFPEEDVVRLTLDALAAAGRPLSTAVLETRVPLRRGRLEMMLKVLDVDGAVRRVAGGWIATGQPWAYDRDRYARVAAARAAEQEAMRRYLAGGTCRMELLRRELDDPHAAPCGRCDVCAGVWFPTDVSEDAVVSARAALDRPGVELEPRTQWPTGMAALGVDVKGRIPADEQAGTGRAVARLSDIGWGARIRELVGPGSVDGPVPDAVVQAVVAVLRGWGWLDRPVAVVAMPSRTRPQLIGSLAARIARIGTLPLLGTLAYAHGGPTGGHGGNSAHRLAAVWERIVVPPDVAAGLAPLIGPVLLVDDVADSRWSLTVAARVLRHAGATAVLPLTLALDA